MCSVRLICNAKAYISQALYGFSVVCYCRINERIRIRIFCYRHGNIKVLVYFGIYIMRKTARHHKSQNDRFMTVSVYGNIAAAQIHCGRKQARRSAVYKIICHVAAQKFRRTFLRIFYDSRRVSQIIRTVYFRNIVKYKRYAVFMSRHMKRYCVMLL